MSPCVATGPIVITSWGLALQNAGLPIDRPPLVAPPSPVNHASAVPWFGVENETWAADSMNVWPAPFRTAKPVVHWFAHTKPGIPGHGNVWSVISPPPQYGVVSACRSVATGALRTTWTGTGTRASAGAALRAA